MSGSASLHNRLNAAVRDIPRSGIRDFFDLVTTMKDVISLGIGEPDFDTPWHVRESTVFALERGATGDEVRAFHSRMGPPGPSWPSFDPPTRRSRLTVADVVAAGARAGSTGGHDELVRRWAAEVWASWSDRHAEVRALIDRLAGSARRSSR